MVGSVDERTVVNREIHVRVVQVKDAGLFREGLQVGEIRAAHSLGSDRVHLWGLHTFRLSLLFLVFAGIVRDRVAAVEDDTVEQHVRIPVLKIVAVLGHIDLQLNSRSLGAAVGLRSRLDQCAIGQDVAGGEVLVETAIDVDWLADEDVSRAEHAVIVARGHIDRGAGRSDVQGLLQVLHRSLRAETVVLVVAGLADIVDGAAGVAGH